MSLDVRQPAANGVDPEEQLPTLQLASGWAVAQLAVLADMSLGKTPGKADYDDNGALKIVKYRDLNDDGRIDWDNSSKGFVKPDRAAALHLRPLLSADVLVSASAHSSEIIGRKVLLVTRVPDQFEQVFVCGEILCIRCERSHVDPLPSFLRYFLQSAKGYKSIQAKVHGVHLIASRAEEISVPVAPANEQHRIVSKIDELFSRIDEGEQALKRVEKLVERYRQSVLKAAVTGELTRDWRAAQGRANAAGDRTSEAAAARKRAGEPVESGAVLLARILKARRAAWEAAELAKFAAKGKPPADERWKQKYQEPAQSDTTDLPDLPEGWVWARLASLVGPNGLITDGDWVESKDQDPDGAVRLVQLADVGDGFFRDKSSRFLTSEKASQLDCTYLALGDVLISRLGVPLGKTCLFPKFDQDCVTVVDVHIFRSGWPELSHEWMMYALNSSLLRGVITAATSGTTRQRITGQKLNDMPVPIPPPGEQLYVVSRIRELLSTIGNVQDVTRAQAAGSQALRQSILKAAFSGQLVPQDPHDEPAAKLLERIAAERAPAPASRQRKKKSA